MEWMSVKDAPIDKIVLVACDEYEHPVAAFCQWYDDADVMGFDKEYALAWYAIPGTMGDDTIKVRWWQPLPEPPK